MIRADLKEPIGRLSQLIYEMQILGEINNKIIESDTIVSVIDRVQMTTFEAINHLGGIIETLSGEILEELKT